MGRKLWQHARLTAAWVLVLTLASVSSVVCFAGASQTPAPDACSASMPQGPSNSPRLDCCITDAPNFDASVVAVVTTPPPAPTLVAADPFGSTPAGDHVPGSAADPDWSALKPPRTPTYLLDSVFRI